MSASPTSVARGGTVTAPWSGIANPTAMDRDLHDRREQHLLRELDVRQLHPGRRLAAGVGFVRDGVPAGIASGTYQIRLFHQQHVRGHRHEQRVHRDALSRLDRDHETA